MGRKRLRRATGFIGKRIPFFKLKMILFLNLKVLPKQKAGPRKWPGFLPIMNSVFI
jgi:hypothetical protein